MADEPPRLSGGLPLLGHMLEFGRNPFELMSRVRQECGEIGEFGMLGQHMVLVTGPEGNEAFARAPDEQLSQSEAYKVMTPIFGKGVVFDAPPERQAEQFGMLTPNLRDRKMRGYAPLITEEVIRSLGLLGDAGETDLLDYTKELTTYTSTRCLIGKEFRDSMTSEFAEIYHDLEQGVKAIAYVFPNLPLPAFRRRNRARTRLVSMIGEIMDKRRASGVQGDDMLQTLMDARYANGQPVSTDEITGMLVATIFAGHHTSAGTAAWVMIELLRNPGVLERVRKELDQNLGYQDDLSYQSLRELKFLEWTIKETLRLHPPLIFLVRKVKYDFEYKHWRVPAGHFLCMSPAVSHQISEVFPEPDQFDPDRYGPGREEDRPFAWIGFGAGRHLCTGNAFAMMQLKLIFAVLLRRYEFELAAAPEGYEHDYQKMVVQPKQPCRVRYRRREAPA